MSTELIACQFPKSQLYKKCNRVPEVPADRTDASSRMRSGHLAFGIHKGSLQLRLLSHGPDTVSALTCQNECLPDGVREGIASNAWSGRALQPIAERKNLERRF